MVKLAFERGKGGLQRMALCLEKYNFTGGGPLITWGLPIRGTHRTW